MAQLRTGILPLRIETGRWASQVCDNPVVEDESHFLFSCNKYNLERIEYYTEI